MLSCLAFATLFIRLVDPVRSILFIHLVDPVRSIGLLLSDVDRVACGSEKLERWLKGPKHELRHDPANEEVDRNHQQSRTNEIRPLEIGIEEV